MVGEGWNLLGNILKMCGPGLLPDVSHSASLGWGLGLQIWGKTSGDSSMKAKQPTCRPCLVGRSVFLALYNVLLNFLSQMQTSCISEISHRNPNFLLVLKSSPETGGGSGVATPSSGERESCPAQQRVHCFLCALASLESPAGPNSKKR